MSLTENTLLEPIPIYDVGQMSVWSDAHVTFEFERPESADPYVDAATKGLAVDPFYARTDGLNFPYCRRISQSAKIYLRTSVTSRLVLMRDRLRSSGLEPVILDGFRNLEMQRELWRHILNQVQLRNQNISKGEVRIIARRYCWDPDIWNNEDPNTWPVHMTGGAVDMTLRRIESGEYLFMGSAFDDPDPVSHADYFERRRIATKSERELSVSEQAAMCHRRILFNAARIAGLTHYWAEWWHFDFGTQLFARACAASGSRPISFYRAQESITF
jgi:zinc D-Ala-D-Ala dipeptidase